VSDKQQILTYWPQNKKFFPLQQGYGLVNLAKNVFKILKLMSRKQFLTPGHNDLDLKA